MADQITARRNDANRPGEEVLVLRHHRLKKGYHQAFERANQAREELVLDHWHRFLQGELYSSPPTYTPVLDENYTLL